MTNVTDVGGGGLPGQPLPLQVREYRLGVTSVAVAGYQDDPYPPTLGGIACVVYV